MMLKVSSIRQRSLPPPFSTHELLARRGRLWRAAKTWGVTTLVVYGANRFGSAIPWLTTWPVTREALCVLEGDRPAHLMVGFPNHVPEARRTVAAAGLGDEVRSLEEPAAAALSRLLAAGGQPRRVGLVGSLPSSARAAVDRWATEVVDLNEAYTELRMTKSEEELHWLQHAAALTDEAARALLGAASNGASEQEMVAAAEYSYRRAGGTHHICYVMTTSMVAPDRCVPSQRPSPRRAQKGSIVAFELSAGWGQDYPAQLLRTATVDAAPTPLFQRLHAVAEAVRADILGRLRAGATPLDLLESLQLVHDEGFTTVDDLVHGLGGGYLPPVLSQRTPNPQGLHAEPLKAGTTIVVQPNVCTPDLQAGVQTGEMVVVTDDGYRSLHQFPPGLLDTTAFRGGSP